MKKYFKKVFLIILGLFLIINVYFYVIFNIKDIPYSTLIYDKNNIEIGELNYGEYRHRYLGVKEYPEFLKSGVIFLEDRSFYNNIGIDFFAIFRALKRNLEEGKIVEGASTISSQLIRNISGLNENRGVYQKLKEFYFAFIMNIKYGKNDILEHYLNNVSFGYMNFGYESASYYYFGKSVRNLTKAEIIALLVIPKNAIKYDPYNHYDDFKTRYDMIVSLFEENGLLSKEDIVFIKTEELNFIKNHDSKMPYIKDFLELNYSDLLKNQKQVVLNIDYFLTEKIKNIADNIIDRLYWKNVRDYGVIILDRKTNNLLVMIGGYSYLGKNGQVNSTLSPRQVGSTLKPFTYALAFENLGWNKDTLILDLPVEFKTDEGYSYNPKNYSLDYKGQVTVAQSLSQSLNIPAIKTLYEVGEEELLNFLREINITSLTEDSSYYGLALTLGVGEINLYELTRGYSIFAHFGELCDINIFENNLENNTNCERKLDKEVTDEIEEILTNRYYKLEEFPVNSALDFGDKKVFVKTGTSRNFKDNWSIGYTKNYIIGVWVGNKDGSEMKGVSGATGAGQIFREIVDSIETEFDEIKPPKINGNIEKYLNIISPLPDSKYEIDEYSPLEYQQIKLDFATNIDYDKVKFMIDGVEGSAFYTPVKGNHKLEVFLFKNDEKVGESNLIFEIK